jgi:hypothetical protein
VFYILKELNAAGGSGLACETRVEPHQVAYNMHGRDLGGMYISIQLYIHVVNIIATLKAVNFDWLLILPRYTLT